MNSLIRKPTNHKSDFGDYCGKHDSENGDDKVADVGDEVEMWRPDERMIHEVGTRSWEKASTGMLQRPLLPSQINCATS